MNNQQFRRLFEANTQQDGAAPRATSSAKVSAPGTGRSSLVPMTPRAVKGGIGVDFARQVRERNAGLHPSKKFKSAAPKGVKYAAGYTDRAKARAEAGNAEDDKAQRIKALEEQVKLDQISQETFEQLRDEITGGDISSTHLVKGLDRKLLERVKRGEDVLGTSSGESGEQPPPGVDEELEQLEDREIQTVQKEKVQKKGNMAPPSVAGVKRSRDEIMAELKAQRKAAAEARAAPALDVSKWRKVGEEKSRMEIDHKGRQVLITVDEDGVVKKKVRKVPIDIKEQAEEAIDMPDASKPVLGADANVTAPFITTEPPVDEDDDIFEGVGTEYNPLGDDSSDSSDSDAEEGEVQDMKAVDRSARDDTKDASNDLADKSTQPAADEQPAATKAPRNYFKDTPSTHEEPEQDRLSGVQNLLKKAAALDSTRTEGDEEGEEVDEEQKARLRKRAEMLAQRDRDFEDMDMGFGESRFDDGEDDGEGQQVRLSQWKGGADDGPEAKEKKDGKKKRSRKRKGDANSMADIMGVIQRREAGAAKK